MRFPLVLRWRYDLARGEVRQLTADLRYANGLIDDLKARLLELTDEPITVIEGDTHEAADLGHRDSA
jgi:hypothetical protein